METRYRLLRLIAGLYQFAGILVLVFALLGTVLQVIGAVNLASGLAEPAARAALLPPSLLIALGILVGGALAGLTLIALGEVIKALLDVEENTRELNLRTLEVNATHQEIAEILKYVARRLPREIPDQQKL